jgi:hypothetical protein
MLAKSLFNSSFYNLTLFPELLDKLLNKPQIYKSLYHNEKVNV